MNCATHSDTAATAYCRTCGKPLCANCTRDVRGVIYCEACLAERMTGVQPQQTAYQQVMDQGLGVKVPPSPGPGPNPALAGILGAIPFGIGAIYCGQYAKGLAHMLIFSALVWGASSATGGLDVFFGLGIAFFCIYQIFDSVRTAKALQAGRPAPDPFGLAQTFGTEGKVVTSKAPTGAIILIGLGALFLLQTIGPWDFRFHRLWPLFLIGLGVWLFAVRRRSVDYDGSPRGHLMGPAVLVTLGTLFLLESMNGPRFGRTWPVLLLVIGLVKLLHGGYSRHASLAPAQPAAPENPQPSSNEVKNV